MSADLDGGANGKTECGELHRADGRVVQVAVIDRRVGEENGVVDLAQINVHDARSGLQLHHLGDGIDGLQETLRAGDGGVEFDVGELRLNAAHVNGQVDAQQGELQGETAVEVHAWERDIEFQANGGAVERGAGRTADDTRSLEDLCVELDGAERAEAHRAAEDRDRRRRVNHVVVIEKRDDAGHELEGVELDIGVADAGRAGVDEIAEADVACAETGGDGEDGVGGDRVARGLQGGGGGVEDFYAIDVGIEAVLRRAERGVGLQGLEHIEQIDLRAGERLPVGDLKIDGGAE